MPSRRLLRIFALLLACMLGAAVSANPQQTSPHRAGGQPISPRSISVSRLDADPPAASVISGAHDARFTTAAMPRFVVGERGVQWWRVRANSAITAEDAPQLVLTSRSLEAAEFWVPGASPLRRALVGPNADFGHSTRALVAPLARGLDAGESVYIRMDARGQEAMQLSIESQAQVLRDDLRHVAWRTAIIATMVVLAILSFGFWLGIGERSYAYLLVTLVAQALYLICVGGELRAFPWLVGALGDVRVSRLLAVLSIIASLSFIAFYLDLRNLQPRLMRMVYGCNIALALLLLANLVSDAGLIALLANAVVLVSAATVLAASAIGTWRGQRAAHFLLMSWLPMIALLVLRIGEIAGLWVNPAWMLYAFPAGFAIAGLVLTIGLADSMQQLRRDRDDASRLATFDTLTGAMSRPATDQRLRDAVIEAHRDNLPLSVVFFDVDHFKRINDEFGHRAGDECLRIIASRTRNRLRRYDVLGRYGGDEMLVILPDTRLVEARGVAENLRSAINGRPLSIDGRVMKSTLSLGIAQLAPGESAGQLLERADTALYASKGAGRDRVSGHALGTITQEIAACTA